MVGDENRLLRRSNDSMHSSTRSDFRVAMETRDRFKSRDAQGELEFADLTGELDLEAFLAAEVENTDPTTGVARTSMTGGFKDLTI